MQISLNSLRNDRNVLFHRSAGLFHTHGLRCLDIHRRINKHSREVQSITKTDSCCVFYPLKVFQNL